MRLELESRGAAEILRRYPKAGFAAQGPGLSVVLRAVFLRNKRGAAAGLALAWFNVPLAVMMGAIGGIFGGVTGAINGTYVGTGTVDRLNVLIKFFGLPFKAQELLPTAGAQIGGIIGGILGAFNGATSTAWKTLVWPWQLLYDSDPFWPFGVAFSQVVVGIFVGWMYVAYEAISEPYRMRISGCRPMSKREAEWILPMTLEAAANLGLRSVPAILMHDGAERGMMSNMRHLIIYRGLIDIVDYRKLEVQAVITHELGHWRNGDLFTDSWSRGVALPLYLLYELAYAMRDRADSYTDSDDNWKNARTRMRFLQVITIFLSLFLWAVTYTVDKLLMPILATYWRKQEFEADAAAVEAGYGHSLRRAFILKNDGIDVGRSGWDQTIMAHHPPMELRLERLERPGTHYGLLDYHPIGRALSSWSPDPSVEKDP